MSRTAQRPVMTRQTEGVDRGAMAWRAALTLAASAVASCATTAVEVPVYRGALDVLLEPWDQKNLCAVTVGLRNVSGVRQGEAWLEMAWFDEAGVERARETLRMDPLLVDRYSAKNLALPLRCAEIGRVHVVRAEWLRGADEGMLDGISERLSIGDVSGGVWRFGHDAALGVYVGSPDRPSEPADGALEGSVP